MRPPPGRRAPAAWRRGELVRRAVIRLRDFGTSLLIDKLIHKTYAWIHLQSIISSKLITAARSGAQETNYHSGNGQAPACLQRATAGTATPFGVYIPAYPRSRRAVRPTGSLRHLVEELRSTDSAGDRINKHAAWLTTILFLATRWHTTGTDYYR